MRKSGKEEKPKKREDEVKTFAVPFPLKNIKENFTITTTTDPKQSNEEKIIK